MDWINSSEQVWAVIRPGTPKFLGFELDLGKTTFITRSSNKCHGLVSKSENRDIHIRTRVFFMDLKRKKEGKDMRILRKKIKSHLGIS